MYGPLLREVACDYVCGCRVAALAVGKLGKGELLMVTVGTTNCKATVIARSKTEGVKTVRLRLIDKPVCAYSSQLYMSSECPFCPVWWSICDVCIGRSR